MSRPALSKPKATNNQLSTQIFQAVKESSRTANNVTVVIYMNDLPAVVPDISITMYANDTEIGRSFISVTEIKQHLIPAFCSL